jgi:methyl-accepting chemotaxis protein
MNSTMTVGKKLTLIGVFLIGLTAVMGISTVLGLKSLNRIVAQLSGDSLDGVSESSKVEADLLELRGDAWRHIAADKEGVAAMDVAIQQLKERISVNLTAVEKTINSTEEQNLFSKIKPAMDSYYRGWDRVAVLSREEKNAEAYKLYLAEVNPAFLAVREAVKAETEYNRRTGESQGAEALKTGSRMSWLSSLMLLLSIAAGSGSLLVVVRGINRVLNRTVSELAEGAQQITSASSQVASSSQGLAQGASEQAASLEETSASSEEITSMTRKNAENSQTAAEVMGEVDRHIGEGNRTVEEMVVSMREITSSSDKISKIIKVIDEIAFQTNILALNAAVEAARAGEAGMGFAVVADEVRNLAQRSAQAAKDTAALIEESITKSNQGSTKLQQVTEVIHAITSSAAKVKMLVDEVNLGSQEQARGIEQISKAIAQMDQVTQATAANAEESASASEEMSAQAEALGHVVTQLRALVGAGTSEERPQPAMKAASRPVSKSLVALKFAVSRPANRKAVASIAPAGGPSTFPMEDDFAEMK